MAEQRVILHATCVSVGGKGVLIQGPSGSGKSALALQMIALGADLVADDRTVVTVQAGAVVATAPQTIEGLIEARGVGILSMNFIARADVVVVVDMARVEVARLPQHHRVTVLDIPLPCLHNVEAPHFPAAIFAYLRGRLSETE